MDITLIIPAYNEENYVGDCLASVARNAAGTFKEVIVVDNASTDTTAAVATRHGARVVFEGTKGLTHARQAGFKAATTEFIAYTDADCMLSENWSEVADSLMRKYPDAISWSGPAYAFDAPLWLKVLEWISWWSAPVAHWFVGYMVLGGNFIVRRTTVERIGGFDTSVAFYGEDMTFARRLSKEGHTVFSMRFFVYRSARRFKAEGFFTNYARYVANFLSVVFLKRPYHREYTDVR